MKWKGRSQSQNVVIADTRTILPSSARFQLDKIQRQAGVGKMNRRKLKPSYSTGGRF